MISQERRFTLTSTKQGSYLSTQFEISKIFEALNLDDTFRTIASLWLHKRFRVMSSVNFTSNSFLFPACLAWSIFFCAKLSPVKCGESLAMRIGGDLTSLTRLNQSIAPMEQMLILSLTRCRFDSSGDPQPIERLRQSTSMIDLKSDDGWWLEAVVWHIPPRTVSGLNSFFKSEWTWQFDNH